MLADLCEKVGTDITEFADEMGFDKRIERAFFNAGLGYNGSCLPKDVKAFVKIAEDHGVDFTLLREVERINTKRKHKVIKMIKNRLWINKDKNIALWGLAFKPETDDIREAPSIDIVRALSQSGANLRLYDPKVTGNYQQIFPESHNIKYANDRYNAVKDADLLVIVTDWEEFQQADLQKVKQFMRLPIIVDARHIYNPRQVRDLGFEYYSIGWPLSAIVKQKLTIHEPQTNWRSLNYSNGWLQLFRFPNGIVGYSFANNFGWRAYLLF